MHLLAILLAGIGGAQLCAGLPKLNQLWTSRAVAQILAKQDPAHTRPIAAVGYQEDSLIFETRGRAERINADQIPAWLAQHPSGLIVIEERLLNDMPSLKSLGGALGLNYARGQWVHVSVAEAAK